MATSTGCGTVFYGRTQKVMLSSSPPGAAASLANVQTTTPGEVRLPRNQPNGWAVYRAAAPGYQPACTLVRGPFKATYLVLDGLFAGLPMLVDLIGMGSLNALRQYPETASLTLRPLEPGETPRPLPSDAEVIHFRRLTWIDLCQPNALKSASVAATRCESPATHIEAAGGDTTRVWWTYYCGDTPFGCTSDRGFAHVTCTSPEG